MPGKKRVQTYDVISDDNDDDPGMTKSYSQVLNVSQDKRRVRTVQEAMDRPQTPSEVQPAGASSREEEEFPSHWEPTLDPAMDTDNNPDSDIDHEPMASEHVIVTSLPRKQRSSDDPLQIWLGDSARDGYRAEYLDEDLRREGRGNAATYQCACKSGRTREYRCESCSGHYMFCEECCLDAHRNLPLHFIQKWNGQFFSRVSLRNMGLTVRLGHEDGTSCGLRKSGHAKFAVIHTNGIHRVNIEYCDCLQKAPHRQQLLRYGWYPSTVDIPHTACTEEVLCQYSALTSKTEISGHGFYQSLELLTDLLGLDVPPSRYKVFLRTVRQHGHIRLMKEAGRGNVANGLETTRPGELAVSCPACPQPGINLPSGWEDADDSCKLKNRDRGQGKQSEDIELHNGLAYFVKTEPYLKHVRQYASQKDISTCSGFRAMETVNSKFTNGLRATGVGMVMCARHEFIRALGVGDLQNGERNCNMDYLFFLVLAPLLLLMVVISYDIACQWKVNLFTRMDNLPPEMQVSLVALVNALVFCVPKFHAPGHGEICAVLHSLNLMLGAGRTDGEGIEHGWSEINLASNSTKEMTLGFRHDTLDLLFTWHNLHKYYTLGTILRRRLLVALDMRSIQRDALDLFNDSIDSKDREAWSNMRDVWEKDHKKLNPYLPSRPSISEADVRARLVQKEKELLVLPHDISPSVFIRMAMSIEDKQRRIRADLQRLRELTAEERTQVELRRTNLYREIEKLREVQNVYMPGISALMAASDGDRQSSAEDIKLTLPSALDQEKRKICTHSIDEVECELRNAQCYTSLDRVRSLLQTRYHFTIHRSLNIRGQRATTRAVKLVQDYERKLQAERTKYEESYDALVSLKGPGLWQQSLKPLLKKDLRALQEPEGEEGMSKKRADEIQRGLGEGQRTVSWIWTTSDSTNWESGKESREGIQIEWLKACARTKRWEEEVELLKEEMRRVRVFLEHRAQWWEARAVIEPLPVSEPPSRGHQTAEEDGNAPETFITSAILARQALTEGVRAHALQQADQQRRLRDKFTRLWEKKWSAEEAMLSLALNEHPDIDSDVDAGELSEGESGPAGDADADDAKREDTDMIT
ncbi:hypothetical protein CONPUDRAFT_74066 [Coniophora puteana RWD-64-598 SS2]|uniref:CxC2-like cysteine cluster KDZ transposase-associated domain-containing protein n=1 Tax=Coniophora puteana (strain RWD-64-598) TaxID=741705 RepID=A0A5M3MKD9_CONPW|nr:uncharacterized protein CONPUDRAFT_74066 [Coniophora puteana RWD-64-598 SS2]EIW79698.1 hypothetical protein CONPUDRAFT_74066 [Coniophora puteana RWD-64-598 SS2]